MKDIKSTLATELKSLVPKAEKTPSAEKVIAEVQALIKKSKLSADCVPGGSYAKGTMLRDKFDVDLFVRFDYNKYKNEDISGLLATAVSSLKPDRVHGSRDYFQVKKNNILFEIIPVLKIEDHKMAVNVTDMSPLHVGYVKSKFAKKKSLANDVRLAKQFCRATGVYGAESYIRGFSGHVLDLLIIYYNGFENLMMQASVWGERVVIDVAGHWKDPMKSLNASKLESPLVLVDPIQPDRNAAASVSVEKFEAFKSAAKKFIQDPSHDFFEVKSIKLSDLKKLAGKETLIVLEAETLEGKDDVVGTKILKVHEYLRKLIEKSGFTLIDSNWQYGKKSLLYYVVKKEKLSAQVMLKGPPAKSDAFCKAFKKVHKIVSEKNGVLYASEKREFTSVDALIKKEIAHKYVTERVAKIKITV